MPRHEPEVLAAVRRRKMIDSPAMSDDSFPGESLGQSEQRPQEQRSYSTYWLLRTLIAWGRSLLWSRS